MYEKLVDYATVSPDLFVFSREKDTSKVVVLTNLGKEEIEVKFTGDAPDVKGMKDYLSGADAQLPATLAPGKYLVFINK